MNVIYVPCSYPFLVECVTYLFVFGSLEVCGSLSRLALLYLHIYLHHNSTFLFTEFQLMDCHTQYIYALWTRCCIVKALPYGTRQMYV